MHKAIRSAELLILALLGAGLARAAEPPQFLIVPVKRAKTAPDPNLSIANYLAQELDKDGRVVPVVWGFSDPIFRQAALDGKIKHASEVPNEKTALEVANDLGAPYVLVYTNDRKSGALVGHAELRVYGRVAWKNDSQVKMNHAMEVAIDDEATSVAHTWALMLEADPLRALAPRPRTDTPTMQPGEAPASTPPTSPTPAPDAPIDIASQIRDLEAKGQTSLAELKVRDAIDEHPMDASLRLLLIHLLERQKQYAQAADQAARASNLLPDNRDLRMCAVRDLIASNQGDAAREQLNEILARDPNDPASMLLQGRIYLEIGRPDEAISALDHLVQTFPSQEGVYWRAVARALLGGADGVSRDAALYTKSPARSANATEDYLDAIQVLSAAGKKQMDGMESLFRQAATGSASFRTSLDQAVRICEAQGAFLDAFPVPAQFKISHEKRRLAQKLLSVCLSDLQGLTGSNSEDVEADARINLGEAVKQARAADDELATEQGQTKHDGNDPSHP